MPHYANPVARVTILRFHQPEALEQAAERLADGAHEIQNTFVDCLLVDEQPVGTCRPVERGRQPELRCRLLWKRLAGADALVLAVPAGNPEAVALMRRLFADCATVAGVAPDVLVGKVGTAFTEAGTGSLPGIALLRDLGLTIVGPEPDGGNGDSLRRLGRRVAQAAQQAAHVRARRQYDPSA